MAGLGTAGVRPDIGSDAREGARTGSPDKRFYVAVGVIALVGFVLRVGYVLLTRDTDVGFDGLLFRSVGLALADGRGYVNPLAESIFGAKATVPAQSPPAWSGLLGLASAASLRSTLSHQLVACLVGSGTVFMTGLAARAAFGQRAGLIAAGLVAVYPNAWLYERELMSEPLAMFEVAVVLWLAYRFLGKPRLSLAIALGVAVGFMALTRSEEIAILVFLVVPVILSARAIEWRLRFGWLALACLACALVIAPWTAYNTTRFEKLVVLAPGLGPVMSAGNCDPTYHGELLGYYVNGWNRCLFGKKISTEPSIADGELRDVAIDFMKENRSRVPVVVGARIGRTFSVYRPFQQVHLEAERHTSIWVLRSGLLAFWILVPFAVVGGVVARRRKIPIYPLVAFPCVVVLSVAFTIGAVRYRAPAEIPLAVLAAFGIDALVTHLKARRPEVSSSSMPPDPEVEPALVER